MTQNNRTQPEPAAGFCTQWGPEDFDRNEREWTEAEGPRELAPPMANVALAVELTTGLDAIREFELQGQTLRLKPTPYPVAIQLLAWHQQLERLIAMGDLLVDHLPDLRDCFGQIAELGGALILHPRGLWARLTRLCARLTRRTPTNPLLKAEQHDFLRLIGIALDTGNEVRIEAPRAVGVMTRYDAAFYLGHYFKAFGAVPGMVLLENGRPQPASWRHYCCGVRYLRRIEAEQSLQMCGAMAASQSGGDAAQKWFESMQRETGVD
jgi:hypothetical protein